MKGQCPEEGKGGEGGEPEGLQQLATGIGGLWLQASGGSDN